MRLRDLLNGGVVSAPIYGTDNLATHDLMRLILRDVAEYPVISADNVYAYVDQHPDMVLGKALNEAIPNLAPPLPCAWIEVASGPRVEGKGTGFAIAVSWREISAADMSAQRRADLRGDIGDVRWLMEGVVISGVFENDVADSSIAPFGTVHAALDTSGRIMGFWLGQFPIPLASNGRALWDYIVNSFLQFQIGSLLLAIAFMHCKNVAVCEQRPSRTDRRRSAKEGTAAPITYRVLDIGPMRRVLQTEGRAQEVGLGKALHICRGHFSTYDERPLFGKHRGTFWVPSHVRGARERGVVVKDYAVHPPKESAA